MLIVLLLLPCLVLCSGLEFPASIRRCKAGDVECIVKVANVVARKYAKGNPDLGLSPLEPYVYNKTLNFSPDNSRVIKMDMKVKNSKVSGLSMMNFQRVVGFAKDLTKSKFEMYGKIPKLEIQGEYTAKGKLLSIPMHGTGKLLLRLEDIDAGVKCKPRAITKGGKLYLTITQVKVRLDAKKVFVNIDNLYSGTRALGSSVNDLLNQNIKKVWAEMYAPSMNAAGDIIKEIVDKVFAKFPYEEYFLK